MTTASNTPRTDKMRETYGGESILTQRDQAEFLCEELEHDIAAIKEPEGPEPVAEADCGILNWIEGMQFQEHRQLYVGPPEQKQECECPIEGHTPGCPNDKLARIMDETERTGITVCGQRAYTVPLDVVNEISKLLDRLAASPQDTQDDMVRVPVAWQSWHSGVPIGVTHFPHVADAWRKDSALVVIPLYAAPVAKVHEPVAWITEASFGWLKRGSQETYGPSLAFPRKHGNYIVPLYAAPPAQDALDAQRHRFARTIFSIEDVTLALDDMRGYTSMEEENVKYDAAIDAAMSKGQLEKLQAETEQALESAAEDAMLSWDAARVAEAKLAAVTTALRDYMTWHPCNCTTAVCGFTLAAIHALNQVAAAQADRQVTECVPPDQGLNEGLSPAPAAAHATTTAAETLGRCAAVRAMTGGTGQPSEFRWCSPCGKTLKDTDPCWKASSDASWPYEPPSVYDPNLGVMVKPGQRIREEEK